MDNFHYVNDKNLKEEKNIEQFNDQSTAEKDPNTASDSSPSSETTPTPEDTQPISHKTIPESERILNNIVIPLSMLIFAVFILIKFFFKFSNDGEDMQKYIYISVALLIYFLSDIVKYLSNAKKVSLYNKGNLILINSDEKLQLIKNYNIITPDAHNVVTPTKINNISFYTVGILAICFEIGLIYLFINMLGGSNDFLGDTDSTVSEMLRLLTWLIILYKLVGVSSDIYIQVKHYNDDLMDQTVDIDKAGAYVQGANPEESYNFKNNTKNARIVNDSSNKLLILMAFLFVALILLGINFIYTENYGSIFSNFEKSESIMVSIFTLTLGFTVLLKWMISSSDVLNPYSKLILQ